MTETQNTPDADTGEAREKEVTFATLLRALLRDPIVLLAVIFLLLLTVAAVFSEFVAPYDPLLPNIFAARTPRSPTPRALEA